MSFFGQKAHQDKAVRKAQEWLEQHYADPIAIDDAPAEAGLGNRTFKRRFKDASSFRRLFKRIVGCTMEQYRKRFSYVVPVGLGGRQTAHPAMA